MDRENRGNEARMPAILKLFFWGVNESGLFGNRNFEINKLSIVTLPIEEIIENQLGNNGENPSRLVVKQVLQNARTKV
jgi:hypothetical protein